MQAYCYMTGARLAPWEVEAIRLLDDEFLLSTVEDKQ